MEVALILAEHPEWDHGPCHLMLYYNKHLNSYDSTSLVPILFVRNPVALLVQCNTLVVLALAQVN